MYRLSEPAFRVLRLAVFPKFKVDLVVAGLCLHGSEDLSCGHFVTGLDAHRSKLAIKCEIVLSMLHEHALIISGHHEHLLDGTIEHDLDLRSLRSCDIQSVVCRQFKILEYRMVLLSELGYDRSVHRPWELAFVGGELGRKRYCSRIVLLDSLGSGRRLRSGSLGYDPLYLLVQSLNLLLLGLKLLLVFLAVLLQLGYSVGRRSLVLAQLLKFLHPLRLHLLSILLQLGQPCLLDLEFFLHRLDGHGLLLHSG